MALEVDSNSVSGLMLLHMAFFAQRVGQISNTLLEDLEKLYTLIIELKQCEIVEYHFKLS